jgi:benzil reductase ((S)-benzoin forming)
VPHSHPLALVTGTSSGIGEALARELLRRGWQVIGAARRAPSIDDPGYTHLHVDLEDLAALPALLDAQVRPRLLERGVNRVALVNNAAMLGLLGPVAVMDPLVMLRVYAVNAGAPTILMGWLLRHSPAGIPVRIVNVSSGVAVAAYPGTAAYGSSKAALRNIGMNLAAELDADAPRGSAARDATILSYEPGTVDTPMQTAVRESPVEVLPIVGFFQQLAAEGHLVAPAVPAAEIADYLEADGHPRWMERRYGTPRGAEPAA